MFGREQKCFILHFSFVFSHFIQNEKLKAKKKKSYCKCVSCSGMRWKVIVFVLMFCCTCDEGISHETWMVTEQIRWTFHICYQKHFKFSKMELTVNILKESNNCQDQQFIWSFIHGGQTEIDVEWCAFEWIHSKVVQSKNTDRHWTGIIRNSFWIQGISPFRITPDSTDSRQQIADIIDNRQWTVFWC